MAQKLLLFWRKPARRCWWEGVELNDVQGVEGTLKVWIRRVWTLEMVSSSRHLTVDPYNMLTLIYRALLGYVDGVRVVFVQGACSHYPKILHIPTYFPASVQASHRRLFLPDRILSNNEWSINVPERLA